MKDMKEDESLTLRIILIFIIIIIFLKTRSIKKTRELESALNELLLNKLVVEKFDRKAGRESIAVEKVDRISGVDQVERVGRLRIDDGTRDYIVRMVLRRNYSKPKRRLEELGYTNVRIRKRMNLIIIETDQGKEILTF
jgi:hypothetical protein